MPLLRRIQGPVRLRGLDTLLVVGLATAACHPARPPSLTTGGRALWTLEAPAQLVEWRTFDPRTVRNRLPPAVRFETVGEVARQGLPWALRYLEAHPEQEEWGISFVEVVRAASFAIDGRSPAWGEDGAAGLWFARVAWVDRPASVDDGRLLLALDAWISDSDFAARAGALGYHWAVGAAALRHDPDGEVTASVSAPGLEIRGNCRLARAASEATSGVGRQSILPPATSAIEGLVRVAFSGHRERACDGASHWSITGSHPLAATTPIDDLVFQFGYRFVGGVYGR